MGKRILKALARRIPFLPTFLGKLGMLSASQVARSRQGFFDDISIRGLPKGIKFEPTDLTPGIALLFGATHYHPVFRNVSVQLVFRDSEGQRVAAPPRQSLVNDATEPPVSVRRQFPESSVWYRHVVQEPAEAWTTLEVWFHYQAGPGENRDVPSSFEFYSLAVKLNETDDAVSWLVDFFGGAPVWGRAIGE